MDYINQEFYKLNKDTDDIVYNFANERITYRKEELPNGILQIVEIKAVNGKNGGLIRVVQPTEMAVEDFDYWKKKLTEEALEYQNKDSNETRNNVSIENLSNTKMLSSESVEAAYIRHIDEMEQASFETLDNALWILDKCLTTIQIRRYLMRHKEDMTLKQISDLEGATIQSVDESIKAAERKIKKFLIKMKKRP